jgi:HD-like signal output (HDOD) protein
VRAVCLRYLLAESFKTQSAAVQVQMDAIWNASVLASDMAFRLAKALDVPNPGALSTQVSLSFVGHLAACSLLQAEHRVGPSGKGDADLLERTQHEQRQLGVGAAELGRLLLSAWQLPNVLVEQAGQIDRAFCPIKPTDDAATALPSVLGYVAARLSEQLCAGRLESPAAFAQQLADGTALSSAPDWAAWNLRRQRLPALNGLADALAAADFGAAMQRMVQGLRSGG